MVTVEELKSWLSDLSDDDHVAVDESGLVLLLVEDNDFCFLIGGIPEEEVSITKEDELEMSKRAARWAKMDKERAKKEAVWEKERDERNKAWTERWLERNKAKQAKKEGK